MREYIVRETGYHATLKREIVGGLVRCKDCKYHCVFENHFYCKWHPFVDVNQDWYCADGERKDKEETK